MRREKTRTMILTAMFVALIAVGAFIQIPVPALSITLQTLFVLMAGLLLGGKNGFIAVLVYMILGLAGLPIFTRGGGIGYIFQPGFGYIIGFALGAPAAGVIANRVIRPGFVRLLAASLAGLLIIYIVGTVYFHLIYKYYLGTAVEIKYLLFYCVLLPLPGDVALCVLGAGVAKRLIPVIRMERAFQ